MIILKLDKNGTQEMEAAIRNIALKYGIAPKEIENVRFNKYFATITIKSVCPPQSK